MDLELLHYLARNNSIQFNINKALEEAVEFQEVVIKLQTKHKDKRPPMNEAIKEYGDFIYRGFVYLLSLFPEQSKEEIENAVEAHIDYKLKKLIKYKEEGKYKGGL